MIVHKQYCERQDRMSDSVLSVGCRGCSVGFLAGFCVVAVWHSAHGHAYASSPLYMHPARVYMHPAHPTTIHELHPRDTASEGHHLKHVHEQAPTMVTRTPPPLSATHAPGAAIAVCFAGWLGVRIPGAGSSARTHLIDPLAADVMVAGTFGPTDCHVTSGVRAWADDACLLARLRGLQPITRYALRPMLTLAELRTYAHGAPAFAAIEARFNATETYNGVNMFAPVLGNPRVSVMRELGDLANVLQLLKEHEESRGSRYSRLVYSRLEFEWHLPHPPVELLSPDRLWIMSGQKIAGVNDRHAVVSRDHAQTYFDRCATT